MRQSKIAPKIQAGQPVKIAMLGNYTPAFVAFAAHAGYDAVWLEMEHRAMTTREIQSLLVYCHLYDIDSLVRPPTRERAQLYRLLEDGATGLIMPHVPEADTAREIVNAVKFPPIGDRGIEGNSLESNFGLDLGGVRQTLIDHALAETLLCVQIETPTALANAEAIAAVPGVDMLYVGPGDMGVRLALDEAGPTIFDVYDRVATISRQTGKPWGSMPRSTDDIQMLADRGATLHVWTNDQRLLRAGLEKAASELDAILG